VSNARRGAIVILDPGDYFRTVVSGAVAAQKKKVSEDAQSYLSRLLLSFLKTESLYGEGEGGPSIPTLAEQLAWALEEESAEGRRVRFRRMGDLSLYLAGFFSNSLSRKLVDVDYYIGMGGAAYEQVARIEEKQAQLFLELSQKFPLFVDLLAQISDEAGFNPENDRDLLRTYDLWVKTGSERLAKQLVKAGIQTAGRPGGKASGGEDS
jgi:hypothetical protein